MYKFQEIVLRPQNSIIFLCGTHYYKKLEYDKRNVLKAYIEDKYPGTKALILEEHFVFGEEKGYLSYDDIFMKNLCDIEELSASFADGIIIIHDSISTGAELAAFATNSILHNKLCVLEPDSTGIEEKKISSFLELAFFNEESGICRIVYYPEVYSFHLSKDHIEKRVNFSENKISAILSQKIDAFLARCAKEINIKYKKNYYGKIESDPNIISYGLEGQKLYVNLSGQILLYQAAIAAAIPKYVKPLLFHENP